MQKIPMVGWADRRGSWRPLADVDHVPELAPDYLERARFLTDIGHLDAAEHAALTGLLLAPDNPQLHVVLGQVHAERADHDAAFASFDHALLLAPDLVAALSARAATAYRVGDRARALADLDLAVELAPHDPVPRFGRALILQEIGRWDEALTDLDLAASLAPDD
jgi:tetratricopeptide (TPR) repeat protein